MIALVIVAMLFIVWTLALGFAPDSWFAISVGFALFAAGVIAWCVS